MLKLSNIEMKYDNILFQNINEEYFKGDFVCIYGESGCGKTSLLNVIRGLEKPTKGVVINKFADPRISYLFQNFGLINDKTVKYNLDMIFNQKVRHYEYSKYMQLVGLEKDINTKVYSLSGGEKQRLAIARLLMQDFEIILCDEPTGNLDDKNRDAVLKLLKELSNMGKLVICVTHDKKFLEVATKKLFL